MQEIKPNHIIQEPSRFSWFSSLIVLCLTFVSTWWLYGYQFIAASNMESLNVEITQLESSIQSASTDRDVLVANILSSTNIRPSIDLEVLVKMFSLAAANAWVRLSGFSVRDDVITSTLIATQGTTGMDPVEVIIAMMRTQDPKSRLVLEPIYSLQGSAAERTTAVSFRILSPKAITNVTK